MGHDRHSAGAVDAAEPDAGALRRWAERHGHPGAAVETDAGTTNDLSKRPLLSHPSELRTTGFEFRRAHAAGRLPTTAGRGRFRSRG